MIKAMVIMIPNTTFVAKLQSKSRKYKNIGTMTNMSTYRQPPSSDKTGTKVVQINDIKHMHIITGILIKSLLREKPKTQKQCKSEYSFRLKE